MPNSTLDQILFNHGSNLSMPFDGLSHPIYICNMQAFVIANDGTVLGQVLRAIRFLS
jgi:hypothetical protein